MDLIDREAMMNYIRSNKINIGQVAHIVIMKQESVNAVSEEVYTREYNLRKDAEMKVYRLEKALEQELFNIDTYCKEHFCVMVDKDVWEKAEKALKQENVLNEMFENIKTEIDFIPTYGAKFADGSINVHVNKKDVLQIIDKYRGE